MIENVIEKAHVMTKTDFQKARPVWLKGLSQTKNISVGLRAVFRTRKGVHVLRIAGATIYRIWLNGNFIGHGPARPGAAWVLSGG